MWLSAINTWFSTAVVYWCHVGLVSDWSSIEQKYFNMVQEYGRPLRPSLQLTLETHLWAAHSNSMCFTGVSFTLPLISLCASIKANRLPGIQNAALHISTKSKWPISQLTESSILSGGWADTVSPAVGAHVCVHVSGSDWAVWLLGQSCSNINPTALHVPSAQGTELVFVDPSVAATHLCHPSCF